MAKNVTWDTSTRLYGIWRSMRNRCKNESNASYKWYGAKGIDVCSEWDNYGIFEQWAIDNGYNDTLTIDRIDYEKDYCPNNCRWTTWKEQENNRCNNHVIEFNGETHNVSEWAIITGISVGTLFARINNSNWPIEKALTTPLMKNKSSKYRINQE